MVMEPAAFEPWLAQQAAGAAPPATPAAARGQELFDADRLRRLPRGARHRRPTARSAPTSPMSAAAPRSAPASCRTTRDALVRWIAPGRDDQARLAHAARSACCRPSDVEALAAYLEGLE